MVQGLKRYILFYQDWEVVAAGILTPMEVTATYARMVQGIGLELEVGLSIIF